MHDEAPDLVRRPMGASATARPHTAALDACQRVGGGRRPARACLKPEPGTVTMPVSSSIRMQ